MVAQELQIKKARMEEWKQNVMREVGDGRSEVYTIAIFSFGLIPVYSPEQLLCRLGWFTRRPGCLTGE